MYKKILVGYDGTKFSEAALDEAIAIAKTSGGEIIVVTAIETNTEMEAMAPELEKRFAEQAWQYQQQAVAKVKGQGVACEAGKVSSEAPYKAIINVARKEQTDVIVLGSHGRTGLLRLLMGSTAERVIGHAPCSVLVVRGSMSE